MVIISIDSPQFLLGESEDEMKRFTTTKFTDHLGFLTLCGTGLFVISVCIFVCSFMFLQGWWTIMLPLRNADSPIWATQISNYSMIDVYR